ncbi:hypothetical protein HZB96_02440 [Candidatus Gottesmanbacteria bacterium]|nr:hypothetical protein [Candidatus Gottesmanbacteria bacterium]MBI5452558.1 hypothetical protein [Candidatus Gottesmanbacteria bacterium]
MNRKELTIITLVIFLTVIAWIAFGIYHARTASTVSQKELRQVVPLTPTFDNDIIRKLKGREE